MDELQKSTFSLFPVPPTPPKANFPGGLELNVQTKPLRKPVASGQRLIHDKYGNHDSSNNPQLSRHKSQPKPLRIRTDVEIPSPILSAPLPLRHPSRRAVGQPDTGSPVSERYQNSPRLLGSPITPNRAFPSNIPRHQPHGQGFRHQPQNVQHQPSTRRPGYGPRSRGEPTQNPSNIRKRDSCGVSQWLDIEGGVDPKKLSVYLGGVLDSSFRIEDLQQVSPDLTLSGLDGNLVHESELKNTDSEKLHLDTATGTNEPRIRFEDSRFQKDEPSIRPIIERKPVQQPEKFESRIRFTNQCECPAGTVICPCRSSDEFEHFRSLRPAHKANVSVSSTVCLLSVPRARFRSPGAQSSVSVSKSSGSSSPPDLAYDSDESNTISDADWQLPTSPNSDGEVFSAGRRSNDSVISRQMPEPGNDNDSTMPRVTSFSRPFYAGTPEKHEHPTEPSTPPKSPTLANISSMSPFTFDFDFDHGRENKKFCTSEQDLQDFENDTEAFWATDEATVATATMRPVVVKCKTPSPLLDGGITDYRAHIIKVGNVRVQPDRARRPVADGTAGVVRKQDRLETSPSPSPRPRIINVNH